MSKRREDEGADAYLAAMKAAAADPYELKACKHEHHRDGGTGFGSVTFFIANKGDDSECWGCFSERMDDAYHMALQRIWALLAPIAVEDLNALRSDSAKEVSVTEMLARAHMAWELAEEMLFAGDASGHESVLVADEREATRRTKMLDAPMRKLLEKTGKRLKLSQDFDGKVGIIERYRGIREKIKAALEQQETDIEEMDADK